MRRVTLLRLLTTERVMGADVRTMLQAWDLWGEIWADRRVAFLPEPENVESEFRVRSRLSSRSPKVWADAYLLAFAAAFGVRLVTFDQVLQAHGDVLVL